MQSEPEMLRQITLLPGHPSFPRRAALISASEHACFIWLHLLLGWQI